MDYNILPNSDIKVSKICLGTMTWGRQNSQKEAFDQMNYSLERGINFFDTAELYPVPATPDKYAVTEQIIGNWFNETKKRDKVILATKIAGPTSTPVCTNPISISDISCFISIIFLDTS